MIPMIVGKDGLSLSVPRIRGDDQVGTAQVGIAQGCSPHTRG